MGGRVAKSILLLLAILGALAAQAQQSEKPAPSPPFEELYKMPAVYSVPGMDQVQVRRDVIYNSVDAPAGKIDLKLDVYTPPAAKPGDRFPAVILISGGGAEGEHDWRDAGVYNSYGRILAASGFIAITFSKRYQRGTNGPSKGLDDFHDMVRYLREHAAELRIDADRLAFWAYSGGGFLLSPVLGEGQPYARAAICFYCVLDVSMAVLSEENQRAMRGNLSVLAQIKRPPHAIPPVFIGRAGLDSPDLNRAIDRFVALALAKNLSIEVMNHPEGRHGFDTLDPGPRSCEIIRRAIEFLKLRLQ